METAVGFQRQIGENDDQRGVEEEHGRRSKGQIDAEALNSLLPVIVNSSVPSKKTVDSSWHPFHIVLKKREDGLKGKV